MKKIFLLLLAVSAATSVSADTYSNNCFVREGFQISASVGFQNQNATQKTLEENGTYDTLEDLRDLDTADLSELFTFQDASGQIAGDALVQGEALNFNSSKNFSQGVGIAAALSMGYKGLFGCGQYSYGISTSIGYEGSFSSANLMADGIVGKVTSAELTPAAPPAPAVYGTTASEVSYYSDVAGTMNLRGGLTIGLMTSLGKEFSWGNVSALVGVKFKEFRLNHLVADFADTVDGDSLVVGLEGYSDYKSLAGESINTYSTQYIKKWSTALSLGFSSQYYISDNLSMGLSFVYDMYAPVTFQFTDENGIDIASRSDSEDTMLQASGAMRFQNNTMSVMMNLTYTFGNPSN